MPAAAAVLCEMKYVCLASVLVSFLPLSLLALSFLPSLLPCLVSLLQQYLYFCTGKASKLSTCCWSHRWSHPSRRRSPWPP